MENPDMEEIDGEEEVPSLDEHADNVAADVERVTSGLPDPPEAGEPEWLSLFPFDAPYDQQRDAIEEAIETTEKGGFLTLEAACGTGKTLISLMAGLNAVRDPDSSYSRVVVLTSVKQQLRAFEDDLQSINENLPDGYRPARALTLVGKADLCAYTESGGLDGGRGFYSDCEDLRDPVRDAMAEAPDDKKMQAAARLASAGEVDSMRGETAVASDEWTSPYSEGFPGAGDDEYCPFYAEYRKAAMEAGREEPVMAWDGVMTPPRMMRVAASKGLCPHAAMGNMMDHAEVVIGNYYHAFEPTTVDALTAGLLDQETFLICDEAHNLVPDVRDLLSNSVSKWTLDKAVDEIEKWALGSPPDEQIGHHVTDALKMDQVSEHEVEQLRDLFRDASDWLTEQGTEYFETRLPDWEEKRYDGELDDEYDIALRDPETVEPDTFSEWIAAHENDYADIIGRAHSIGASVTNGLKMAAGEISGFTANRTYADSAGRALTRWDNCGHTAYFRQVTLERRERRRDFEEDDERGDWEEWFSAHLTLNNCLPSTEIAERLDMFGGGILMSATLAPLDVYQRVSGIAELGESRPLKELIYGLPFPEENRTSCAVDLTSFTYSNRGSTYQSNDTREAYAEAIRTTAQTTPGNVLVAMPSYAEAEWAADVLEKDRQTDKPILVDESSGVAETEELKQEFFAGPGKVLVTGMRGTLTEGVDYCGDRLDAAIVCGVPIRSLSGDLPDAIKLAYEKAFGKSNGFEYAFSVPAVRKARQAIGRVIRSTDDLGARILADDRYAGGPWNDVREFLPPQEQEEFSSTSLNMLEYGLETFWEETDR